MADGRDRWMAMEEIGGWLMDPEIGGWLMEEIGGWLMVRDRWMADL